MRPNIIVQQKRSSQNIVYRKYILLINLLIQFLNQTNEKVVKLLVIGNCKSVDIVKNLIYRNKNVSFCCCKY